MEKRIFACTGGGNFSLHDRRECRETSAPLWPFGAREEPLRKGDFILNQTNHYQLSQWEPTDRILMENFNGDNQKIDAALKANAEAIAAKADADTLRYVKICEKVTESAAAAVDLIVSDVDFTQYLKVELFARIPGMSKTVNIRVNNIADGYCYGATSGGSSGPSKTTTILASFQDKGYGVLLFYPPNAQANVGCVTITSNGSSSFSGEQRIAPVTWENLTSFNFYIYQDNIPAGSRFALYGVKA